MQHESAGYETVAHNVLRVHRAGVNLYVVLGDEGVTLIDAGLPGSWRPLMRALRSVAAGPKDIRAVVLTHGHFDHVGLCAGYSASTACPSTHMRTTSLSCDIRIGTTTSNRDGDIPSGIRPRCACSGA